MTFARFSLRRTPSVLLLCAFSLSPLGSQVGHTQTPTPKLVPSASEVAAQKQVFALIERQIGSVAAPPVAPRDWEKWTYARYRGAGEDTGMMAALAHQDLQRARIWLKSPDEATRRNGLQLAAIANLYANVVPDATRLRAAIAEGFLLPQVALAPPSGLASRQNILEGAAQAYKLVGEDNKRLNVLRLIVANEAKPVADLGRIHLADGLAARVRVDPNWMPKEEIETGITIMTEAVGSLDAVTTPDLEGAKARLPEFRNRLSQLTAMKNAPIPLGQIEITDNGEGGGETETGNGAGEGTEGTNGGPGEGTGGVGTTEGTVGGPTTGNGGTTGGGTNPAVTNGGGTPTGGEGVPDGGAAGAVGGGNGATGNTGNGNAGTGNGANGGNGNAGNNGGAGGVIGGGIGGGLLLPLPGNGLGGRAGLGRGGQPMAGGAGANGVEGAPTAGAPTAGAGEANAPNGEAVPDKPEDGLTDRARRMRLAIEAAQKAALLTKKAQEAADTAVAKMLESADAQNAFEIAQNQAGGPLSTLRRAGATTPQLSPALEALQKTAYQKSRAASAAAETAQKAAEEAQKASEKAAQLAVLVHAVDFGGEKDAAEAKDDEDEKRKKAPDATAQTNPATEAKPEAAPGAPDGEVKAPPTAARNGGEHPLKHTEEPLE